MAKELFVSSSPHETKVAVLEDDQLVEVYYEREADVGLVGSIYKGRVSRVLPGMQSAFVNIGLERDAFLYVSDFVEDEEEYDKIFSDAEARATRYAEAGQVSVAATPMAAPPPEPKPAETTGAAPAETAPASATSEPATSPLPSSAGPSEREQREHGRREHRGRRRRRGGRRDFRPAAKPDMSQRPSADHSFEVLPGESLAKYRGSDSTPPEEDDFAAAQAESTPAEGEDLGTEAQGLASAEAAPGVAESFAAPIEQASADGESFEMQGGGVSEATGLNGPPSLAESLAPVEEQADATTSVPPEPEVETFEQDTDSTEIFAPVAVFKGVEPAPGRGSSPEKRQAPNELDAAAVSTAAEAATGPSGPPESGPGSQAGAEEPAISSVDEVGEVADGEAVDSMEDRGEFESGPEPAESARVLGAEAAAPDEEAHAPTAAFPGPSDEVPAEAPDKKYTLVEPHQRPRFAPRRRRGRRGMGRRPARRESSRPGNHQPAQISDLLKEGQEIIVQIAKEPLGAKGARITSHIALPGRYLVFMPTIDHIGVSRKITSEDERLRLRNVILENRGSLTGGFIVRTAGAGRSEEELKADLKFLSTMWNDIRAKAERVKAPALLHRDLDLMQRILRDTLSPDFKQVRVDNELEYERCVEFVSRCQPSLVGHVKLYTRDTPMFEEFGIQQEVDKALRPKVWLKSGGYIVINQTEALVAIDVNTGKYVGKTNRLEDTIVKTNIDAVNEIVRQIRLRDLGGIIVIDFIDMDERKNRYKVVQALEEALRRDRAPTKILSFNDFGLVAVTRKRVKQSLERTLSQPCTYCSGSGWIKSVTTVCHEIMGEVKKMAKELEGDSITLRVNPEVAQALKSRQGALLSELEALTHKDIIVKGDPTVHQERFDIY